MAGAANDPGGEFMAVAARIADWYKEVFHLARSTAAGPYPFGTHKFEDALWRALAADGGFRAGSEGRLAKEEIYSFRAWVEINPLYSIFRNGATMSKNLVFATTSLLLAIHLAFITYGVHMFRTWDLHWNFSTGFWLWLFYVLWRNCSRIPGYIHIVVGQTLSEDFIPNLPAFIKYSQQLSKEIRPFMEVMSQVSNERRFCRTEKGYFGWVSVKAGIGDAVVLFRGSPLLFTMRPTSTVGKPGLQSHETEVTYWLTGDCYLQGLMHGEVFQVPGPEVDITLV